MAMRPCLVLCAKKDGREIMRQKSGFSSLVLSTLGILALFTLYGEMTVRLLKTVYALLLENSLGQVITISGLLYFFGKVWSASRDETKQ